MNEWLTRMSLWLRSSDSITAVLWILFSNVRGPAGKAALPQVRRKRSGSHDPINSELHLLMCLRCIFICCVILSALSHQGRGLQASVYCSATKTALRDSKWSENNVYWLSGIDRYESLVGVSLIYAVFCGEKYDWPDVGGNSFRKPSTIIF